MLIFDQVGQSPQGLSRYQTLPHLVRHSPFLPFRSTLILLWVSAARSPVLRTVFISFVLAAVSSTLAPAAVNASLERTHRYTHPHTLVCAPARRPSHPLQNSRLHRENAHRIHEAHRAAQSHPANHRATHRRAPGHRSFAAHSIAPVKATAPAAPADDSADPIPSDPAPQPAAYRRTRRIPMPAPLLGSLASLERQNERTDADGLERILDDEDLNDRIARKMLVPVPVSANLSINPDLPANRRYCRPWTARFLADLARAHAARFHHSFEVSSAVRTVAYQKRLMLVNGNAAAAEGDIVSPHLTGATIDIAKSGLTLQEIAWMRARLLALELDGKLDVEEEFQQACFHITVYKSYLPPPAAPRPRRRIPPGVQIASRGR